MGTEGHWVGTWATSPAPSEAGLGFNNHTLRMNPRISIGGDTLRVRVSNAYGNGKLAIGAAYIGIRDKGPAIVPGSERALTFGGSVSATVAAGALVVSDSVRLEVKPLADLVVSLYLPGEIPTGQITGRYARQTNYISPPGNFAAERAAACCACRLTVLLGLGSMAPSQAGSQGSRGDLRVRCANGS